MAPIEPVREGGLDSSHETGERLLTHSHGEMNVVCHQAIREHLTAEPGPVPVDPIQVLLSIFVVPKDGPTIVSACGHVVQRSRKLETGRPRHQTERARREPGITLARSTSASDINLSCRDEIRIQNQDFLTDPSSAQQSAGPGRHQVKTNPILRAGARARYRLTQPAQSSSIIHDCTTDPISTR
jgi:hypothetical protein